MPTLEDTYTYHAPHGDQQIRYERIRKAALHLAQTIADNSRPSREQSLALTNVQQAGMWANAGIAINEAQS